MESEIKYFQIMAHSSLIHLHCFGQTLSLPKGSYMLCSTRLYLISSFVQSKHGRVSAEIWTAYVFMDNHLYFFA